MLGRSGRIFPYARRWSARTSLSLAVYCRWMVPGFGDGWYFLGGLGFRVVMIATKVIGEAWLSVISCIYTRNWDITDIAWYNAWYNCYNHSHAPYLLSGTARKVGVAPLGISVETSPGMAPPGVAVPMEVCIEILRTSYHKGSSWFPWKASSWRSDAIQLCCWGLYKAWAHILAVVRVRWCYKICLSDPLNNVSESNTNIMIKISTS